MRVTTQLRITSTVTIAALILLAAVLIGSFIEFKSAKNDYILADAVKVNFFERASFGDQYFLYREDRARLLWDQKNEKADRLLRQADIQFQGGKNQKILERLRKDIGDSASIFNRIVNNTEVLKTAVGNRYVYQELDKRLFSQLLLRTASTRDTATALQEASAQRVELTYRRLTLIIGLFAFTLALATIMTSTHLGRLIRKRLAPLHDGAKIVAGGDLAYRIECDGSDEFTELAQSINAMTDKLEAEISAHKQAEEMLRKLSIAVEQSPATVVITDLESSIQYVNSRFTDTTGYSASEAIGQNPRILQSGRTAKEIYQELWGNLTSGRVWKGELLNKRKNGELYWEEAHVAPVKNPAGAVTHYVAVKTDITARKQAEERISELNRDFVSFLNNSSDFIYFKDVNSRFRFCSQTLANITGHASWRDMIGKHDLEVFPKDVAQIYIEEELPVYREGKPLLNKIDPYFDASGKPGWISASKWPLLDQDGKVVGLFGISRDITERIQMENALKESEFRLRTIIENEPECIKIVDEQGRLMQMNPAGLAMIEADSLEQVAGRPVLDVIAPEYRTAFAEMHERVLSGKAMQLEFEVLGLKGGRRWLETNAVPLLDHGKVVQLAVTRDITERKRMEDRVRQLAFHDALTALPNRRLLNDRLSQSIAASKRSGCHAALMFLDLDNFKPLNDTHGHAVGDLLLIEVADRLKSCVREIDTVARFGGDEFVVILNELDKDKAESTAQARIVAEKIYSALAEPYLLPLIHDEKPGETVEHHCTASIGLVMFANHEGNPDDILKWADTAMYQAKESGRNSIRCHDSKV
jgi:diguanylate cyclase (GGDEF)-like protein/PAS domain S-box-containing protein